MNATWLSANANINTSLCTESGRRMHADYYGLSSALCVLLQQSTVSSSHVGSQQTSGSDRGIPCHSPSSIPCVAMVITSPQVLYIRVYDPPRTSQAFGRQHSAMCVMSQHVLKIMKGDGFHQSRQCTRKENWVPREKMTSRWTSFRRVRKITKSNY
jgi:hypothetical protein